MCPIGRVFVQHVYYNGRGQVSYRTHKAVILFQDVIDRLVELHAIIGINPHN